MKFSVTKESDSGHLGRNHHGVIFNQSELCFEDIRPITGIDFDILTISIFGSALDLIATKQRLLNNRKDDRVQ